MPPLQITNTLNLPGNGIAVTVADFAVAMDGGVLQFDCRKGHPTDALRRAKTAGPVQRIPANHFFPGKCLPRKASVQAECLIPKSDLLIAHSFFQAHVAWARQMGRKYTLPYWLVPSGTLDPMVFEKNAWAKQTWMRVYGHAILRDAAGMICATRREADKIQERFHCPTPQVVHWPVDLPDLSQKGQAREALRLKYRLNPDSRVLLFLGRLHGIKQPAETVEAFSASDCKNTVLILAGPDDGPAADAARKAAVGSAHILFIGMVQGEHKNELLLGADGFISLSLKENFGYTTAESLAAGLPVILSPGHDLAPELKPAKCGWLLDRFDKEEAVEAIRAFDRASAADLSAMGASGRAWAEKHLRFKTFQTALRSLYPLGGRNTTAV